MRFYPPVPTRPSRPVVRDFRRPGGRAGLRGSVAGRTGRGRETGAGTGRGLPLDATVGRRPTHKRYVSAGARRGEPLIGGGGRRATPRPRRRSPIRPAPRRGPATPAHRSAPEPGPRAPGCRPDAGAPGDALHQAPSLRPFVRGLRPSRSARREPGPKGLRGAPGHTRAEPTRARRIPGDPRRRVRVLAPLIEVGRSRPRRTETR